MKNIKVSWLIVTCYEIDKINSKANIFLLLWILEVCNRDGTDSEGSATYLKSFPGSIEELWWFKRTPTEFNVGDHVYLKEKKIRVLLASKVSSSWCPCIVCILKC